MVGSERSTARSDPKARTAGWIWACSWLVLLVVVHVAWGRLGGVVSERVLWLVRFTMGSAVVVGCLVGSCGRRAALRDRRHTHGSLLRWMLWPQAACIAVALVALRLAGRQDAVGVVVAGLLGYWAGLDLGFAAWPLMHGRHYAPWGAIESDPSEEPCERGPSDHESDDQLRPRLPI